MKTLQNKCGYKTIFYIATTLCITSQSAHSSQAPSEYDLFNAAAAGDLAVVQNAIESEGTSIDALYEDLLLQIPDKQDPSHAHIRYVSTLLTWASKAPTTAVTEYLLKKGARFETLPRTIERDGIQYLTYSRPLLVALQHGNYATARFLIKNQAGPREPSIHTDLIKLNCALGFEQLLDCGVFDQQNRYESGLSLLLLAARYGTVSIAELLATKYGHPVNQVCPLNNDHTALHQAAQHGHFEMTRWLLERGALVNAFDTDKSTPLHCAAIASKEKTLSRQQLLSVARLLFIWGAQDNPTNPPLSYTAQEYAHLHQFTDMEELLAKPPSLLMLCMKFIHDHKNLFKPLLLAPPFLPEELSIYFATASS